MITDWNQTNTDVTIFVPIYYKVDMKKVDYTITELYVKLNIPEMKLFQVYDLEDKVDISQSKMVLEERRIIFILKKVNEGLWKELSYKGTKEELKQRRKEADIKYEEKIKADREQAEKTKQQFSKFVIDQSIKIDEDKRNELLSKKKQEKQEAERDLYAFVEQYDNNKSTLPMIENARSTTTTVTTNARVDKVEDEDDEIIQHTSKPKINRLTEDIDDIPYITPKQKEISIPPDRTTSNSTKASLSQQISSITKKNNEIFTDEDIKQKEHIQYQQGSSSSTQPIQPSKPIDPTSSIRQQTNIPVTLTEKKIPTFAARESLSKEPPYPKSKKYVPEKNYLGQEIDDRNPIWIKERADNFFKNNDYRSAINAYNKALEIDSTFHKCLLNRGTCLICLGEFDLALKDFEKLIELISLIEAKEKEDAFYDKILVRAYCKMYAIYALKQEYTKALEVIDNKLLIKANSLPFIIPEPIWKHIEKDKALIIKRQHNEELKLKGDAMLTEKNTAEAKRIYTEILSEEKTNERVLSNLSLIYLSENNYEEAIVCCTTILKIIKQFKEKIKARNVDNSLEIKTLLRRANCYERKGEMILAEKDIEQIEKLEIKNEIIFNDIKGIKDKLKTRLVETYKENANNHLTNGEFSEALGFYDRAISLIKYSPIFNKVDMVKLLLNRTSCLIKLSQYEKAIEECERILMILSKQKAIATIQSNFTLLDEIKQLEFLSSVKRAFVYTTIGDSDRAIQDYENGLVLKPGDTKVKENLEKLKLSR